MDRQLTIPIDSVAGRAQSALVDVLAVAGLMTLGAWIRLPLPFTPVPLTLQTLPVLVAAFLVGRNRAMAGALLYMVLGLAGAPVLAVGATFGVTFGYLVGFAAAPWVAVRFRSPLAGLAVATAVILGMGAAWLSLITGCSPVDAVRLGALPFVPGDLFKAVVAYAIIRGTRALHSPWISPSLPFDRVEERLLCPVLLLRGAVHFRARQASRSRRNRGPKQRSMMSAMPASRPSPTRAELHVNRAASGWTVRMGGSSSSEMARGHRAQLRGLTVSGASPCASAAECSAHQRPPLGAL